MYYINEEFLKDILVSRRAMKKASNTSVESPILFKSLVIFGAPGSGKTSIANYIAKEAFNYYGIENVNARYVSHGEIGFLIRFGVEKKLVNILFIDNLTLVKVSPTTLQSYFNIRHHQIFDWQKEGYVLSIVAIHRFHSCPLEVRTIMDGLIVLDSTMNPYDRTVLKQFVGEDVLKYMDDISAKKQENPELKSLAYYKSKSLEGWVQIPLVKERYLKYVME
jgi:GTPase SAR1 family protein